MIDLIQIGLSGQELVDKVNEVIAAINDMQNITSFNNLNDKPSINGHTVQGSLSFTDLGISVQNIPGYQDLIEGVVQQSEKDDVKEECVEAAETAVSETVDAKVDKNISSYSELAGNFLDGAELFAVCKNGSVYKMKLETLMQAAYTYIKTKDTQNALQVVTQDDVPQINNDSYWFDEVND